MRLRRLLYAVAAALIAAGLLLLPRTAGTWLAASDPLPQHAGAIVVLGGQVPFRAMEAAAIYRQNVAREVWLTQGAAHEDDIALARLGIDRTPEHLLSREVLLRLGVPADAIRIIPDLVQNTAEEVRAIFKTAANRRIAIVILVTSKYHARRVKILWRRITGGGITGFVRYAEADPTDLQHWWRDTDDAMAVARELFGIANAWAGFPIASRRQ
jgi:uncharacterized SAM-binding protein YcdF (DUF218 family)